MQRPLLRNRFFYTSYFWIFRIAADRFSRRKYRTVKGIERMADVPDRPVFMETCVSACRISALGRLQSAVIVSAAAENGNGMYGGPNFCISFPSGAVSDKIVIFAGMTLPAPTG